MVEGISNKTKLGIIATVILVSLGLVFLPQFIKRDLSANPKVTQFQITPKPREAYERALKGGRPIFLEFYAKW